MKTARVASWAFLALSAVAVGQDAYEFIDRSTGTTNGPFVIYPYADVRIGGREYQIRPSNAPLSWESHVVPSVHLSDATLRAALDKILPVFETATNDPPNVVVFRESLVAERITMELGAITLGELLRLFCGYCDVTLLRDRESEAIVLMPNALADGRSARVLGILPGTYDRMIEPHGSFNRLLVEVGVIKRESHALCDFQRDRSLLILYGSPEVFLEFECVFNVFRIQRVYEQRDESTTPGKTEPSGVSTAR